MKNQMLKISFAVVFGLIISSGYCVVAQSTQENSPVRLASRVMSGRISGNQTYYYSLRAKRGNVVTVRAKVAWFNGTSFSLDFRGMQGTDGGQKQCCDGDSYLFLDHGSRGVKELKKSFTVISDQTFLMAFTFNTPNMIYTFTFDGIELDDELSNSETIRVSGKSGNNWRDTGINIKKGDKIILSATGTVDVSAGWGVHDANGTRNFADLPGYPVNSQRRYGLAAKVDSQKWAYNGRAIVASRNGRLYLTCNDDNPDDNEGEFIVNVRIIRTR